MVIKKLIKENFGFTIMEMMVVISVIVIGLLGILSLGTQNTQVISIDKNTVIASQLAQEGLEVVRNKRDMNWLQKANWETSSSTGSHLDILQQAGNYAYTVDAYTGAVYATSSGGGLTINSPKTKLYLNSAGFYTHQATASSTIFSRLITVGNESAASTSVTCLIKWQRGTNTYNFSAQTVLYNWK
jgi:prepilin-type N-terminal cleavage/methylation domain-containing protein